MMGEDGRGRGRGREASGGALGIKKKKRSWRGSKVGEIDFMAAYWSGGFR